MRLSFWGATETVTGSKYLLEAGGRKILVDCGLFQGLKKLRRRNWQPLPMDPSKLDAVVVTHAHIDHTGYLPALVKAGFHGPIYSTKATRDLCQILLPDAGYLQEEEANFANKHGFSRHKPALPLYTQRDAERALQFFRGVPFSKPDDEDWDGLDLGGGVRFRFMPDGHILGASWLEVTFEGTRLVFSGDVGRPHDFLMNPPAPIRHADYLVLESTYGNRRHSEHDIRAELGEVIRRTAKRGGIVLIPAFAVGRSQTLMYLVSQLKKCGEIPNLPVFLNSPMAISVTGLYRDHSELHRLTPDQCEEACGDVTYVHSPRESQALNSRTEPAIIIAASGMATGGRVVHHIAAFAPNPKNTILFVGYQAAGTRGEAMVNGAAEVKIHGRYVPIHCEIATVEGLSAHADYVEMTEWLRSIETPPRRVFLTHGEPAGADGLRRYLHDQLGWECEIPQLDESVELATAHRKVVEPEPA